MSKDKDNILVDLYNLQLTENPEQDRDMIIEFFKRADPNLTKYLTAKATEGITDSSITGSLGWFEKIFGMSWFETEDTKDFYDLWKFAKEIIDTYLNDKPITQWQYDQVENLLEYAKPKLRLKDKATGKFLESIPESFELGKYEFDQGLSVTLGKIAIDQGIQDTILTLGLLKYRFFVAIQQLMNGKVKIKKCGFGECDRVFIAYTSGHEQIYCQNNHRQKAFTAKKKTIDIESDVMV